MIKYVSNLIIMFVLILGCSQIPRSYVVPKNTVKIPVKSGVYPELTLSDKLRGELNDFKNCYDIHFYRLNVDVDILSERISGIVEFHANVIADLDTVQFDLYKNLEIEKIIHNNQSVEYYRVENSVYAILPNHSPDEQIEFTVSYSGIPKKAVRPPWDGGFVWSKDKNNNPWIGVACEGDGASLWWPNKDHPTEEPDSMEIIITVPSNLVAVSNGKFVAKDILENDSSDFIVEKARYTWSVKNPINNYNVTLNIGDYVVVSDTLMNNTGVQFIDHYVLSYSKEVASEHFKQAIDVVHYFEKVFGEYPWWEDGYRLVETPYRGMEHQSAIAYGNEFENSNNYYTYDLVDYIILHETAHEWWGNNVTACDGADVWIHESFGTYAEVMYIEEKLGKLTSIDYLMTKRKNIRNLLPMKGPRHVNYWGFDDVYWKGAWMIHTLRSVINDDPLFYNILLEFQIENRKSIVCTEDFIQFVNEKTNDNYHYFFDQYLYNRKPPTFEYFVSNDQLTYQWTDVNDDFEMPLIIVVNKTPVTIYPSTSSQNITIPLHAIIEIPERYYYMAVGVYNILCK